MSQRDWIDDVIVRSARNECTGCTVCDGSGVISVTDWPESRVLVCPHWPADKDEPLAYWQAVEGLGYSGPATMQKRITERVMAEVEQQQQVRTGPTKMARGLLIILAICIPFWIGMGALIAWLG